MLPLFELIFAYIVSTAHFQVYDHYVMTKKIEQTKKIKKSDLEKLKKRITSESCKKAKL